MPTISIFYGISIIMNLLRKEHNPPHIHATYGGIEAKFRISDGELMEGEFPKTGSKLVKQFILHYQQELLEMWETETYRHLDPID